MVGVAANPRACHDCKRRKVKCDYRKPTCLRCEKAQIACHGYRRERVFVNRTPGDQSTTALSVLKQNRPSSPDRPVQIPGNFDRDLQALKSLVQKPISPPTQFRLRALELLKKLYLPQPSHADIRKSTLFSWIPTICELEGDSLALDHALLTFCVIQVAITKTGTASIDEGLQVYSNALQTLRGEIQNARPGKGDEILAAISILTTCELFILPTDHAWRAHAQGISEIIRIQSVVDTHTPIWQTFCTRIRIVLLIESLVKRQNVSMAGDQCRQLKFTSNKHDSFQLFLDAAWEVPNLLVESERLLHDRDVSPEQWRATGFDASLAVLEKLYAHHQKYRAERARPLYWAVPSRADNPVDGPYPSKLFPFALQFESLESASQVILWWGIVLHILRNMIELHQHFDGSPIPLSSFDPSNTEELSTGPEHPLLDLRSATISSVKEAADKLARYICQSVEYSYNSEHGTIGPQMMTFARWVVISYFRQLDLQRELDWCLNIKNMTGPGFFTGIELMGFQD